MGVLLALGAVFPGSARESAYRAWFNSIHTLSARLRNFHALSGGMLSSLPLAPQLRGKSTRQSHGSPIYYVDLTLRDKTPQAQAITTARTDLEERKAAVMDQTALDVAARAGYHERKHRRG